MKIKPRRYTGQGDLHFITFSCYQRRPLLGSVRARNLFLKILGEVRVRHKFELIGYVVMPEHVHLIISEPKLLTPSQAMQIVKQRVSRRMRGKVRSTLNQRRFWQRRFYDFNIYSEAKLKEKLDYMHGNPVKRKLVRRPQDWAWSSFSFYELGEAGLIAVDVI
jgi:putative transposase